MNFKIYGLCLYFFAICLLRISDGFLPGIIEPLLFSVALFILLQIISVLLKKIKTSESISKDVIFLVIILLIIVAIFILEAQTSEIALDKSRLFSEKEINFLQIFILASMNILLLIGVNIDHLSIKEKIQ